MAINFFPKVVRFFTLFRQQNDLLTDTAGLLSDLFSDYPDIAEKARIIVQKEHEGDDLSKEIARQLSLTFITPIDREDIHAINMAQENLLNSFRAISTRIGLYRFSDITPGSRDLVLKLKEMTILTSEMLNQLSRKEMVEENSAKAKELKIEAEMLLLVLLGEIYERPVGSPDDLLEIIKWSHIYDRIEEAFAHAGALANIIEGITLKNA
jgi:uncharacterized protein Yka (UPF0111/DUF47 family)